MKSKFTVINDVQDLQEAFGNTPRIDADKGVIHDVVLLTGKKTSKNRTHYMDSALQEAATRYDGAKMYIDHPSSGDGSRSVRDLGGVYHNVRREGDQIRGDLHLLESQGIRDLIIPIAKARPSGVGLSIKDKGRVSEKDGVTFVESFKPGASYSIDFVTDVSTNKDLFESNRTDESEEENMLKLSDTKLEDLAKENPALCEQLRNEGKASLMKELEEAKAKGVEADKVMLKGKKLISLAEANLPAELHESTKTIIELEAVTLEEAVKVIASQKTLAAKMAKTAGNGNPVVKGVGADGTVLQEGTTELPTDEQVVAAFRG